MKLPSLSLARVRGLLQAGRHPHPVRDWFVLLGVAAVLVGLSAGWNVWSYIQVTAAVPQTASPNAPHGFSTTTIGAVDQAFVEREEEVGRYRSSYRFVDPSR